MSWCVSPWVYPVWVFLCLLDLIDYFLFYIGKILNFNLFKNFLIPFLFPFFWDPYNSNVGVLDMVPEVSEIVLSSFHSFYFILLFRSYFHWLLLLLCSRSPIHSSVSDILLLIDSRIFLTTVIVLFFLHCYSLIFLGLFKLILAFSPFYFQGFWSSFSYYSEIVLR